MKARFARIPLMGMAGVASVAAFAVWREVNHRKQIQAKLLKNQMLANKIDNPADLGKHISSFKSHYELKELLDLFSDEKLGYFLSDSIARCDLLTIIQNKIYESYVNSIVIYYDGDDINLIKTRAEHDRLKLKCMAVRDQIYDRIGTCLASNIKNMDQLYDLYWQFDFAYQSINKPRTENSRKIEGIGGDIDLEGPWSGEVFFNIIKRHIDIQTLFSSNKEMFAYVKNTSFYKLRELMFNDNVDATIGYLRKAETLNDILFILAHAKNFNMDITHAILNNTYPEIMNIITRDLKNIFELARLFSFMEDANPERTKDGTQQAQLVVLLRNHPVVLEANKESDDFLHKYCDASQQAINTIRQVTSSDCEKSPTKRLT